MLTAWSIFLFAGLLSTGAVGIFLDVESVVLQADNGDYLSRARQLDLDLIVATNSTPSEFSVERNFDGTISFKADNRKYISVIEYSEEEHLLAARKDTIDMFCKFLILNEGNGQIAITTGSGCFWTRAELGPTS